MDKGLRKFINITEGMNVEPFIPLIPEPAMDHEQVPQMPPIVEKELLDLIFKMRNYRDSGMGDYSAGIEAGLERAAEMIQNALERIKDNNDT